MKKIRSSLVAIDDFFSIPILAKTLFAPFRQISVGEKGNDIGSKFRAWGDRTISRIIGAFVRFFMIILGLIVIIFVLIISSLKLALWPLVPFLPLLGLVLTFSLGVPWKLV